MKGVNALITDRMQSDVPIIPAQAEHLIAAGGKRLRPLLTVAAARLAGSDNDHCLKLASKCGGPSSRIARKVSVMQKTKVG